MIDKHPNQHPLIVLFYTQSFSWVSGMNWLQERGHVSDLCVTVEDVAACDVDAVLEKAGAWWAKPGWQNLRGQDARAGGRDAHPPREEES